MVVIRLSRKGAKKSPFYHVVVIDKRARREGAPIERVGYFHPLAKPQETKLHLELERIEHWIGEGAQPSDTVADLIKLLKRSAAKNGELPGDAAKAA